MDKELVYDFGDEEHDEEFIYSANYDVVCEVLAQLFADTYGIYFGIAECIISDYDLYDSLEEIYKEDLLEHFRDEALEAYQEYKEFDSDHYSFYGISESDFH